jgi:RimJ/RimL family protein N-acetyltransferase
VRLEPWGEGDGVLLQELLGDPEMIKHLGGPETAEKFTERQAGYQVPGSRQYKIVVDGDDAGWVGYWEREWRGEHVFEMGWSVVPRFQGRGVASGAYASMGTVASTPRRSLPYDEFKPGSAGAVSGRRCSA